jgi:uncharacterized protein (UPF0212 family)
VKSEIKYSVRLKAQHVINCISKPLLAAKVTLGSLNRDIAEQELNLVQLTVGEMTKPGTCTSQIMRPELVDIGPLRRFFNENFRCHAVAPNLVSLVFGAETCPNCLSTKIGTLVFACQCLVSRHLGHVLSKNAQS